MVEAVHTAGLAGRERNGYSKQNGERAARGDAGETATGSLWGLDCNHGLHEKACRDGFYNTCICTHIEKCSYLIVMRWQLVEELLDPELLSRTVHIGNLILRQTGEV